MLQLPASGIQPVDCGITNEHVSVVRLYTIEMLDRNRPKAVRERASQTQIRFAYLELLGFFVLVVAGLNVRSMPTGCGH